MGDHEIMMIEDPATITLLDSLREANSPEERLQWFDRLRNDSKCLSTYMSNTEITIVCMAAMLLYLEFSTDETLLKTPDLKDVFDRVLSGMLQLGVSLQDIEEVEPSLKVQTERLKKLGVL